MSDPEQPDSARYGDDLLIRIDELTDGKLDETGNGWRHLLRACSHEIIGLRTFLKGIAARIDRQEERNK